MIDRFESLEDTREVVTSEISHEARKFVVTTTFNERRHQALIAEVVEQPLPPSGAALERQCGVELVGSGIYPRTQSLATGFGKSRLLQLAVFEDNQVPTHRAKELFKTTMKILMNHCV